jgi:GNAT superfamily N-acetyltransferase
VWADPRTSVVTAYYAVAPHEVARQDLPPRIGRGSPDRIPAILLARLALHRSLQGQRLGSQLLLDALELIVAHARGVGGRLVVVDAIDAHAAGFYTRHGFAPIPDNPTRLVQKLSRVASTLGMTWP